jgi:hypothetical protein
MAPLCAGWPGLMASGNVSVHRSKAPENPAKLRHFRDFGLAKARFTSTIPVREFGWVSAWFSY